MLQDDATIDALELTGGSSLNNPMYLFRGPAPRREFAATLPPLMRFVFRVVGRRLFHSYPFEEAYFRDTARAFKDALDMPVILLGGINTLETISSAVNEGFAFVAMARALLSDPNLVNKMQDGRALTVPSSEQMSPDHLRETRCLLSRAIPVSGDFGDLYRGPPDVDAGRSQAPFSPTSHGRPRTSRRRSRIYGFWMCWAPSLDPIV